MEFEWDEAKRQRDVREKGLDFRDAMPLFDGRAVMDATAKTTTEVRLLTTGRLGDGKFYTVVWTMRGQAYRIITFRRAHEVEERRYVKHHGDQSDP